MAIIIMLSVKADSIIAMDSYKKPVFYGVNENIEKQNSVPIIKNEFLNTYIEELTESTKDFTEYYFDNMKKLSSISDIVKIINNNVSEVLNIALKYSINPGKLEKLRECIRNLNMSYIGNDVLIKKLFRIILNCHSILNELKVQYVASIIDN